jgi:hypothetical protein
VGNADAVLLPQVDQSDVETCVRLVKDLFNRRTVNAGCERSRAGAATVVITRVLQWQRDLAGRLGLQPALLLPPHVVAQVASCWLDFSSSSGDGVQVQGVGGEAATGPYFRRFLGEVLGLVFDGNEVAVDREIQMLCMLLSSSGGS